MLENAPTIIEDFVKIAIIAGIQIDKSQIIHECVLAPHSNIRLKQGHSAIYVFSRRTHKQEVLKVGKVGPNSSARFTSQHYLPESSGSNLSKSLFASRESRPELVGIEANQIGQWIRENTDRDHFFLVCETSTLSLFEAYLHCRLRPTFEG